jgi:hypothetical protein
MPGARSLMQERFSLSSFRKVTRNGSCSTANPRNHATGPGSQHRDDNGRANPLHARATGAGHILAILGRAVDEQRIEAVESFGDGVISPSCAGQRSRDRTPSLSSDSRRRPFPTIPRNKGSVHISVHPRGWRRNALGRPASVDQLGCPSRTRETFGDIMARP